MKKFYERVTHVKFRQNTRPKIESINFNVIQFQNMFKFSLKVISLGIKGVDLHFSFHLLRSLFSFIILFLIPAKHFRFRRSSPVMIEIALPIVILQISTPPIIRKSIDFVELKGYFLCECILLLMVQCFYSIH